LERCAALFRCDISFAAAEAFVRFHVVGEAAGRADEDLTAHGRGSRPWRTSC
jgi:hypothetical protein